MQNRKISMAGLAYCLEGDGLITVVIETCLGGCSAEWWHIADDLCTYCRVLTYDRAGYGQSASSRQPRTPANIADELNGLLKELGIGDHIILVGHSQGGLYSVEFALRYLDMVRALVLLDPLTPFDDEFKAVLTKKEYKNSGVEKIKGFQAGKLITSLGLGFAIRSLLRKSPPFYYYDGFSKEATSYMMKSLTQRKHYETAIAEYTSAHIGRNCDTVRRGIDCAGLGELPVLLFTHSSPIYLREMEQFSNIGENASLRMENCWQANMKRYQALSSASKHIDAKNSGHYIHLTDYDSVRCAVLSLIKS